MLSQGSGGSAMAGAGGSMGVAVARPTSEEWQRAQSPQLSDMLDLRDAEIAQLKADLKLQRRVFNELLRMYVVELLDAQQRTGS